MNWSLIGLRPNYALERSVSVGASAPQARGKLSRLRRPVGPCRGPLNADVRPLYAQ